MAAKDITGEGIGEGAGITTISERSVEATSQDWAISCGVCHAGGGSLEYDRDMKPYGSGNSGDDLFFELSNQGPVRYTPKGLQNGYSTTNPDNKAEADCLMCHMKDNKPGMKWYISLGCGTDSSSPYYSKGPAADRNCDGDSTDPGESSLFGLAVDNFASGTAYDMYNRNQALKHRRLDLAASAGIGGTLTFDTNWVVDGITDMPTEIPAEDILGTPNNEACSVCHARNENTVGLPSNGRMKTGYGAYYLFSPPGTNHDIDSTNGTANVTNPMMWEYFGCKTGMGKRAHKIGVGGNDKWGLSLMNMMFGLGKTKGDPVVTETFDADTDYNSDNMTLAMMGLGSVTVKERMPDEDVHAANMECATCHYALGSEDPGIEGADISGLSNSGTSTVVFPAVERHGVTYLAEAVQAIDHQFAQSDNSPDTKSKNNLDGTVSCESCHIDRSHPHAGNAKTPLHAGLPAVHIEKIACTTCHIPEVYAPPARLKVRDWSAGTWKGDFRHMLDWNFDMMTGSHTTIPVLRAWYHNDAKDETQITPYLPAVMPIWIEKITKAADGSDMWAPVKNRDTTAAVKALIADGNGEGEGFNIRTNKGSNVPLFDGFATVDSFEIDTKAELDAMVAKFGSETATGPVKLKLFQANFDATHGVAPKEWALGGSKRGGCVSCHSSADPTNPDYSPYSIAFFESYQQPINNAGMGIGKFDLLKNQLALFADYDCAEMCVDGFDMLGNPNMSAACTSPVAAAYGMSTLGDCVDFMTGTFDKAMNFPAGTAKMMGMWDGVSGIQGFVVAEGAPQACNPFSGVINMSPMNGMMGMAVSDVNHCMPDSTTTDSWGAIPNMGGVTWSQALQGTCDADPASMTGYSCNGGFKNGAMCNPANTLGNDCQGAADNMYIYSRAEAKTHFKVALQQSKDGSGNNMVTWPIEVPKNPGNPAHVNKWDQATVCVDPMTGAESTCGDGGMIKSTIHANQLLGYADDELANLMNISNAVLNCTSCHTDKTMGFMGGSPNTPTECTDCHTPTGGASGHPVAAGMMDSGISHCAVCHQNNGIATTQMLDSEMEFFAYSYHKGKHGAVVNDPDSPEGKNVNARFNWYPGEACYSVNLDGAMNDSTCTWSTTGATTANGGLTNCVTSMTFAAAGRYEVTLETATGKRTMVVTATGNTLVPDAGMTVALDGTDDAGMTVAMTDSSAVKSCGTEGDTAGTAIVLWGDGTTTVKSQTLNASVGTHTYGHAGTYTIRYSLRDSNGNKAMSKQATVTVPQAGKVLTITGNVSDGTDGIENVTIYLKDGNTIVKIAKTDDDGNYSIPNVQGGTIYTVVPVKLGYELAPAANGGDDDDDVGTGDTVANFTATSEW